MFDRLSFDLAAYLARIGYEGVPRPDLETLRAVALKHPLALPFENLDPFLGRPVALDIDALQNKMVRGARGGFCFEHNLLLGTALAAIGFELTGLAARVMWNNPPDARLPRSHMLLLVPLEGERYLVDAGFGGLTLTGPLRLEAGVEQETPHETFRVVGEIDGFVVQASVRGAWTSLYRFDLQPQLLPDYEVTCWYLCNNPRSHFLTSLVAARAEPDRRHALRNTELATHHRGGTTERRILTSPRELRDALEDHFRIAVPSGASLDEAFRRISGALPA